MDSLAQALQGTSMSGMFGTAVGTAYTLSFLGMLVAAWFYGGQILALLVSTGIATYITSDGKHRSGNSSAYKIVCWICVGIISLSLLALIPPMVSLSKPGLLIMLVVFAFLGMVAVLVPPFMLISYSTKFKRSAFSTQEWSQLGGALAGIKQSVDQAAVAPAPVAAPAGTVMDVAPSAGPAWGKTVIEEPENIQTAFASLRVVQGSGVGRMFDLKANGETRVGRDAALNDIILDDPKVSGQHAKIRAEGEKYGLFELGSSNGTTVNGITVNGTISLSNQDKIVFGNSTAVVFQLAEA